MKVKIRKAPKAKNGKLIPLTQDMALFSGPSHEEGGIPYKGIEVEGGEPLYQNIDGSQTVFGNMYVPGTKQKFKEVAKILAKKDRKAHQFIQKGNDILQALGDDHSNLDQWDTLKQNSAIAMMEGGALKSIELKKNKEHLANLQQALLETADEMGADPFSLSKGKIVKAKNGYKIKYANGGDTEDPGPDWKSLQENVLAALKAKYPNEKFDIQIAGLGGKRSIEEQLGVKARHKGLSKSLSMHNLDLARDFVILKNGKNVTSEYKNILHTEAKKLGLNSLSRGDDPGHISAGVEDGTGSVFANYLKNNPDFANTDTYKGFIDQLGKMVKSGTADDYMRKVYASLSGDNSSYIGKLNYKNYSKFASSPDGTVNFGEGYYIPDYTPPTLKDITPGAPKNTYNPITVKGDNTPLDVKQPADLNIPSNAKGLDWYQIAPELAAFAQNKVEPVWMQQYNPQLFQNTSVSFQDRLNANNNSFKALQRIVGNDPTALATLAGQKYAQDNAIMGDEFRTNQQIEQDVVNRNISLLNDAQLKNLSLADTQYVRQNQAKANTKALNNTILNSITGKVAQNEAMNNALQYYENLTGYRYDPSTGKLINYNGNGVDLINWGGNSTGGNNNPNTSVKETHDADGNLKSTSYTTPSTIKQQEEAIRSQMMLQRFRDMQVSNISNRSKTRFKDGGSITKFFNSNKK